MSLLWKLLDRGVSKNDGSETALKITLWFGRQLALRNAGVVIPESCRIHPRAGKIRMGENCRVAAEAIVQGPVTMGNNCSL